MYYSIQNMKESFGVRVCVCVFLDEFVITVGTGCVNIIACGHFGQEDLWQVIEFRKGRRDARWAWQWEEGRQCSCNMKFKTLKGISISITSQSAGKRKSKDKKRTCDAMQCDATFVAQIWALWHDRRQQRGERGRRDWGMRGSMISMCVLECESVCECARSSAVAIDDLSCAATATRRIYMRVCVRVCECSWCWSWRFLTFMQQFACERRRQDMLRATSNELLQFSRISSPLSHCAQARILFFLQPKLSLICYGSVCMWHAKWAIPHTHTYTHTHTDAK